MESKSISLTEIIDFPSERSRYKLRKRGVIIFEITDACLLTHIGRSVRGSSIGPVYTCYA